MSVRPARALAGLVTMLVGAATLPMALMPPALAQQPTVADVATRSLVPDPKETPHGHPGRRIPSIHRAIRDLGRARAALAAAPAAGPLGGRRQTMIATLDDAVARLEGVSGIPRSKPAAVRPSRGSHPGEGQPDLARAYRNLGHAELALSKASVAEKKLLKSQLAPMLKSIRAMREDLSKTVGIL